MDEKTRNSLIKDLYFTAEAAEYLEISKERFEQIVNSGQLRCLKRNADEAIFLKEDLETAAQELQKYERAAVSLKKRSYIPNNSILQRAINYFVLQSYYNFSEEREVNAFQKISDQINTSESIENIADKLGMFAKNISREELFARSKRISESFALLKQGDLIVGKDAEEYPDRFKNCKAAPAYLFMRGNAELLKETVIAVVEGKNFSSMGRERAASLFRVLGAAGIITACLTKTKISETVCASALQYRQRPILVTSVSLNQVQESGTADYQQGLMISSLPPHIRETDSIYLTAEEVLFGISDAVVVIGDADLVFIKGRVRQKIEISKMEDLFTELEKVCDLEVSGRRNVFSKGIEVEYVYNSK